MVTELVYLNRVGLGGAEELNSPGGDGGSRAGEPHSVERTGGGRWGRRYGP